MIGNLGCRIYDVVFVANAVRWTRRLVVEKELWRSSYVVCVIVYDFAVQMSQSYCRYKIP